jgi:hypothetical protein
LASVASKASCGREPRLMSRLLVAFVAGMGFEEGSIFVWAEAIVRSGLSRFG